MKLTVARGRPYNCTDREQGDFCSVGHVKCPNINHKRSNKANKHTNFKTSEVIV